MGEDQNPDEDQQLFAGTQGERIPAAQVYEFLATMAHELRNPMTPILGQVQLLRSLARREGPLPDKMHRGLEGLELAVEVFMRRATMLLEVSRIASGRLELRPSLINLSALTAETIERYAPLAEMARTSIALDAPPSVKGVWDRVALEQILDNLISNALKYADEKPITVTIAFEHEVVRLEVRDRGIGIPAEEIEQIFDRFHQGESSRGGGGFGVGLWVVRHLCKAMGGSVNVESVLGKGSIFTVSLPLSSSSRT
jgi:two-component system OmpR family sensor kinase